MLTLTKVYSYNLSTLTGFFSRTPHSRMLFFAFALYLVNLFLNLFRAAGFIPLGIAATMGTIQFITIPGLLFFTLLSLIRKHTYSYYIIFLISISLGFSYNFIFNVIVFVFNFSIGEATRYNFALIGSLFTVIFLLAYAGVAPYSAAGTPSGTHSTKKGPYIFLLAIGLGVCVYLKTPPPYYLEDFFVLRHIFEGGPIRIDSLGHLPGEYTTYLFVPFYMMLSMVAYFAQCDVFEVVSNVWPFFAVASVLCVAKLTQLISGSDKYIVPYFVFAFAYAIFFFAVPAASSPDILPFPDRYAISASLMFPLALFHFFIHFSEEKINLAMLVGLIYLIIEITFVHARETLYLLWMLFGFSFLLSLKFKTNRFQLARVASVIGVVFLIVLIYSSIATNLNPETGHIISKTKELVRQGVAEYLEGKKLSSAYPFGLGHYNMFRSFRFYSPFSELVFSFSFLALFVMPFFTKRAEVLLLYFFSTSLILFSLVFPLKALILYLSGVPFIIEIFTILHFVFFIIFVHFITVFWRNIFLSVVFIAVVLANFLLFSFNVDREYIFYNYYLEFFYFLAALLIVVARASGSTLLDRPKQIAIKFSSRLNFSDLHLLHKAGLLLFFCVIAFRYYGAYLSEPVPVYKYVDYPQCRVASSRHTSPVDSLLSLFQCFTSSEGSFTTKTTPAFLSPKPLSINANVLEFVRKTLKPGRVWMGDDTLLLLVTSHQYAANLTLEGFSLGGFEKNILFHNSFLGGSFSNITQFTNQLFPIIDIISNADLLDSVLEKFKIDAVIISPFNSELYKKKERELVHFSALFEKVYDAGGYLVFTKK